MTTADLTTLAVLVLATARIVRLMQRDHLTERWRERVFDRWPCGAGGGREGGGGVGRCMRHVRM